MRKTERQNGEFLKPLGHRLEPTYKPEKASLKWVGFQNSTIFRKGRNWNYMAKYFHEHAVLFKFALEHRLSKFEPAQKTTSRDAPNRELTESGIFDSRTRHYQTHTSYRNTTFWSSLSPTCKWAPICGGEVLETHRSDARFFASFSPSRSRTDQLNFSPKKVANISFLKILTANQKIQKRNISSFLGWKI